MRALLGLVLLLGCSTERPEPPSPPKPVPVAVDPAPPAPVVPPVIAASVAPCVSATPAPKPRHRVIQRKPAKAVAAVDDDNSCPIDRFCPLYGI